MIDRRVLLGAGLILPAAAGAQSWRFGRAPGFRSGLRFLSQIVATTWNPADKGPAITLSNGNLTATSSSSTDSTTRSIAGKTSGKWYFEVNVGGLAGVGVASSSSANTVAPGNDTGSIVYYTSGGINTNGNTVATYASYGAGDIVSVAIDVPNKRIWFAKNGVWGGGSGPSGGTTGSFTITATQFFAAIDCVQNGPLTANFGATAFAYTPPTGYGVFTPGST